MFPATCKAQEPIVINDMKQIYLSDFTIELNNKRKKSKAIKKEIHQYRRFLSESEQSWLVQEDNIETMSFSTMLHNIYYDNQMRIGEKLIQELKNRKKEYELEQERKAEQARQRKKAEEERQRKQKSIACASSFKSAGVIYANGKRYTYYSSRVLRHYRTHEWTAGIDGIYRDSSGYIVVAASDMPQGALTPTPFGTGKVYDSGCAAGTIDVYTNF